ncbi:MAG TPA: Calx-beta domain-containing protein, partial [Verrucomicrobiae bacterium]|nr:Calx-beta domain-containing protein [Verrucomicrobiae bacterium]
MKLSCFFLAEPARVLRCVLAGLALTSLLIPQPTPASGVVTNCADADLRAALAGGGTVTFACDGTITLTNTLTIATNTTLDASGRQIVLSGGGAVRVFTIASASVELVLMGVTVADGFSGAGGAVGNSGALTAIGCTFSGNRASGGLDLGGAIANFNGSRVTLDRCSFVGNTAARYGGAIGDYTLVGPILITNCTFAYNAAPRGAALGMACAAEVTDYIVNCTFFGHTGNAVENMGAKAPVLINSILSASAGLNCAGSVLDGGHNLSSDSSCNFTNAGSLMNTDPRLAPLASYGGPTLTMALIEGSPAIDVSDPTEAPTTDQRGQSRPIGAASDLGAFEGSVPMKGIVQVGAVSFNATENGTAAVVTVVRSGDRSLAGTISFASSDGTATGGLDYAATNGLIAFTAGETNKVIEVLILNDAIREVPETFRVTLSNPTGGLWLMGQTNATVIIHDDDVTVLTDCTPAALREALSLGGTIRFACDGTILLDSNLVISTTTWLDAEGRDVTLDGGLLTRVVTVPPNVMCTMAGLKVAHGRHPTDGAGIVNEGSLVLWRCTFSNNVVSGGTGLTRGGAVLNLGTLEAMECTFVTNRVETGSTYGGAIHNAGVLRVDRCAFLHNVALANGGAIANWVSTPGDMRVGITNSTFFGNRAIFGGASGVHHLSGGTSVRGQPYVVNCTFAGGAGGVVGGMGSPGPWVANSIVGYCQPAFCSFVDGGNNLVWGAAQDAIDLRLGPLTNNGGPTLTMAPMPDSPAVNQGNNAFCPLTDQRGIARPFGPACDIGACEATVPPSPSFLQFSAGAFTTSEDGGTVAITVTRTGSSAGAASVHYATSDGTALTGSDYAGASGVLNLANGQTSAVVVVSIQNDLVPEPDETIHLTLSAPSGGPALGSPTEAVLTIHDDDPASPGTLQFSSESYSVSESDGEAIITVLRTGGTNGLVSAEFYVADGTANASDYVAATGTVVLLDTEVRKSFAFQIVSDAVPEGPETVVLGLRNPTGGAAVSGATTTLSILDANQTVAVCDEPSLRAAVAGGGKITLACDGSIFLTSPLVVSNGVSLDAVGHNVSLSGNTATRLFVVVPGATLTLRSFALVDGLARGTNGATGQSGEAAQGGAICNSNGVLNAYDCSFLRHRAQGGNGGPSSGGLPPNIGSGGAASGGAVFNWLGWVNASNCVFAGNRADGGKSGGVGTESIPGGEARGGAICNISGVVHVVSAILSSNVAMAGQGNRFGRAPAYGGAFFNVGDAALLGSSLEGNSAISDPLIEAGGGALSHYGLGILTLTDCTVSDNRALGGQGLGIGSPFGVPGRPGLGGGLHIAAGEARLTNTTLAHNWAVGGAGVPNGVGAGQGGGLYTAGAVLLV